MYAYVCDTYEITDMNHVTKKTVQILCKLHIILFAYMAQEYMSTKLHMCGIYIHEHSPYMDIRYFVHMSKLETIFVSGTYTAI